MVVDDLLDHRRRSRIANANTINDFLSSSMALHCGRRLASVPVYLNFIRARATAEVPSPVSLRLRKTVRVQPG